jgi:Mg2+ and Co2+ transporter CorA
VLTYSCLQIFHLISQEAAQRSIDLAAQSRELAEESKTLARNSIILTEVATEEARAMKMLALVALFFLPPTTIAAIFTMPFFDWSQNRSGPFVSSRFWIYCVTAALLTMTTVAVWYIWIKRTKVRKLQVDVEKGCTDTCHS